MRALTFQAPGRVTCERVAEPHLEAPGDALVRVELAAICGSDLHPYLGRETGLDRGTVLGHEAVGEVVEVGLEVVGFVPGDRVFVPFTTSCGRCFYCRRGLTSRCPEGQLFGWLEGGRGLGGTQAELLRVPLASSTLVAVPPGVGPELALLAGDNLATGLWCAHRADLEPGDSAAVVGCGAVGLMAVAAAVERGVAVLALDRVPERLALAELFGARPVDLGGAGAASVVAEATRGRGVDAVLEAVGSAEATRLAVDLVRPGGTVSAVGVHTEAAFPFAPGEAYDKNLTYRLGRCPARAWTGRALELARRTEAPLERVFSHSLPLAEGPRGYELAARRLDGCIKVLLVP